MERIMVKKLSDSNGIAYWVFYEIGKFETPLFILDRHKAESLSFDLDKSIEVKKG